MNYLDELSHELALVGIRRGLRARILAELADHLECDPEANEEELGAPAELAREFADQLGTTRVRRAAFVTFSALVVAGCLFALVILTSGLAGFSWAKGRASERSLIDLAGVLALVSPQVALVTGLLAGIRALRFRRAGVLPRAEALVIGRRTIFALLCGIATMVGMGLMAIAFRQVAAGWWTTLALISAGVGACVLAAAVPTVAATIGVKPTAPGSAGDIFDDIGPFTPAPLRGRPWAFAGSVAAAIAVTVTAFGVLQADPFDGAARGIIDGLGCLAGFALLGRYLGLRDTGAD